jgi:hypothetical protein
MRFLNIVAGRIQQIVALVVSTGAPDAGRIVATGADGRLDETLMPVGIGADIAVLPASEILAGGDFVSIWNDAGTAKARKADATTAGKEAQGFVLDGASAGANATVYFEGRNTSLTGLTAGARYYLSAAAPGGVTTTPPSAAGNVVQYIGTAYSATELAFEATDGIIIA